MLTFCLKFEGLKLPPAHTMLLHPNLSGSRKLFQNGGLVFNTSIFMDGS